MKSNGKKIIITLSILIVLVAIILVFSLNSRSVSANPKNSTLSLSNEVLGEYSSFIRSNKDTPVLTEKIEVKAEELGLNLLSNEEKEVLGINDNEKMVEFSSNKITLNINTTRESLSQIYLDYMSLSDSYEEAEVSVEINGEYQYSEASQIVLDTLYEDSLETPNKDRYGNDISIPQQIVKTFQTKPLRDGSRLYYGGNYFKLNSGSNEVIIHYISGKIIIKSITFETEKELDSYSDYIKKYENNQVSFYERIEAEDNLYKNSSSMIATNDSTISLKPYSINSKLLNVVGSTGYYQSGDLMTWEVEVPKSAYYNISIHALQSNRYNSSYRTLYVNGEVPFEEAKHLLFSYNAKWQNYTLKGFENNEYKIYLNEGKNTISLEVDSSLFAPIKEELSRITNEMNTLGLNVKKITGNNTDKAIDWDMESYFPNLKDTLNGWKRDINNVKAYLQSISGFNKNSYTTRDLETVTTYIDRILKNVDNLPRKLGLLSEGDSCAAQVLAQWIDAVTEQPLEMDAIFIYTDDKESSLDKPVANFFKRTWIGIRKFFISFFDKEVTDEAEKDELEVWVNRSRVYVDQLQILADSEFTPKTGIKVKISLMNDEGKLVLSNAANQQPDVALGVSAWIPNEYGMRGAIYDLSQFSDLGTVIENFYDEELVPGIFDGHLYSIPETENFYVLFYRKDILDALSLSVPSTWDDVIGMLPTLTRYGMSFYIPLSSAASSKSFDATSPFIYQFGGSLYSDDNMHSGLEGDETISALTFMTDLYKEYGFNYNVTSFFNNFRYGTVPIGVADFGTYLSLMNAAPELKGLWAIDLVPGVERDGEVYRYSSGAQQSMMIFNKTKMLNESWEFIKWWSSTDAQVKYSNQLVNSYGKQYIWNSANYNAFSKLDWSKEDKEIILNQWKFLKEVPKIPGSYIIEREISNIWNAVVFDDENLRNEVSDASIRINRELVRKLKQFGFYDENGNLIRAVVLPDSELIRKWREQNG